MNGIERSPRAGGMCLRNIAGNYCKQARILMGQGTLCLRPDGRRYDFGMPRIALLASLPNMMFLHPLIS
jgi:hypothetical protein